MVLGMFSVTTATRQHFTIATLRSPIDVRLWLSRGKPTLSSGLLPRYQEQHALDKYSGTNFHQCPLESSIPTLKAIALPRHLLDSSVVLFIIGIGLYELSGWKTNVNGHGVAYRDVFIVFIVTLSLYIFYHAAVLFGLAYDTVKRDREFGTGSLYRGFDKENTELQKLRDNIEALSEAMKYVPPHNNNTNNTNIV